MKPRIDQREPRGKMKPGIGYQDSSSGIKIFYRVTWEGLGGG